MYKEIQLERERETMNEHDLITLCRYVQCIRINTTMGNIEEGDMVP